MSQISNSQFLIPYILHHADNNLILAQRNSEWCGHGPVLEQDIAITNISLDLIGQARNFYQYAAQLINDSPTLLSSLPKGVGAEVTEDTLAYLRTETDFKNFLLVEQPKGDWGQTILRQFFYSTYQHLLYQGMQNSRDTQLVAIAAKSIKEVTYHLRWSSEWVIRLGDGTEESHNRMLQAIDVLWEFTGELFQVSDFELEAVKNNIGVDVSLLKEEWVKKVKDVFDEATLPFPPTSSFNYGGKQGKHSEHLGHILAEMQYLQRTYPGVTW